MLWVKSYLNISLHIYSIHSSSFWVYFFGLMLIKLVLIQSFLDWIVCMNLLQLICPTANNNRHSVGGGVKEKAYFTSTSVQQKQTRLTPFSLASGGEYLQGQVQRTPLISPSKAPKKRRKEHWKQQAANCKCKCKHLGCVQTAKHVQ